MEMRRNTFKCEKEWHNINKAGMEGGEVWCSMNKENMWIRYPTAFLPWLSMVRWFPSKEQGLKIMALMNGECEHKQWKKGNS